MISENSLNPITAGARLPIRAGLFLVMTTAVGALILGSVPESLISWDAIPVVTVALFLVMALYPALAATDASCDPTRIAFRSTLTVWMFLLASEELFSRSTGDLKSVLREEFSVTAYGELGFWVVAFLVLLVLFLRRPRPQYLRFMFSGRYRWVSILCILLIVSTARSPRPLYGLAWSFKLLLVVVLLAMCSALIRDSRDLIAFLRATLWACLFYLVIEVYRGLADPSTAFEGGRFGQSSNSLSVIAGTVLILTLTLRSQLVAVLPIIISIFASTIMILSGGKAGIASGALSATLFYLMRKKVGSAAALLTGVACLGFALYLFTPLGSYFNTYAEQGGAETLSGRTKLWAGAQPLIQQRLILGHGYMASKFAALQLEGVHWEADHMHNAFLDVLYNNGLLGLGLVLILHGRIIRNLLSVLSYRRSPPELYNVAAGSLALYLNLVISAFFNSTIAGRPSTLFMLFLAVFVVSESLQRELSHGNLADLSANARWSANGTT
jgi:O-antigen ligase